MKKLMLDLANERIKLMLDLPNERNEKSKNIIKLMLDLANERNQKSKNIIKKTSLTTSFFIIQLLLFNFLFASLLLVSLYKEF